MDKSPLEESDLSGSESEKVVSFERNNQVEIVSCGKNLLGWVQILVKVLPILFLIVKVFFDGQKSEDFLFLTCAFFVCYNSAMKKNVKKSKSLDYKMDSLVDTVDSLAVSVAKGFDRIDKKFDSLEKKIDEKTKDVRRDILNLGDRFVSYYVFDELAKRVKVLEEKKWADPGYSPVSRLQFVH